MCNSSTGLRMGTSMPLKAKGTLGLRRALRRAIWVIIMERGELFLFPFVNGTFEWGVLSQLFCPF